MNFNTDEYEKIKEQTELKISCSGIVRNKDKKCIYVMFERGDCYAEGRVPDFDFISVKGFTADELENFKEYMKEYEQDIINQARSVNMIKNFMGNSK